MVLFLKSDIPLNGSLSDFPLNGSLFDIPDEPPCYVRQCSLYAYLILIFICNVSKGLHYISLYALSLHSTFTHLRVPFTLGVSQNKRTRTLQGKNSNFHYIYNSNRNLFIIIDILFTCVIEIHKALFI